jgi:superfamily II DNA or RNA helicase
VKELLFNLTGTIEVPVEIALREIGISSWEYTIGSLKETKVSSLIITPEKRLVNYPRNLKKFINRCKLVGIKPKFKDERVTAFLKKPLELHSSFKLRPYQVDAVAKMLYNLHKEGQNSVFLKAGAGSGKEQPLYSKILTPTGWTTMGEVSVGDKVISMTGKPTKVLGVYPQGVKDVFRLHFTDGSTADCGIEHLWLAKTKRAKDYKIYSTKDLLANGVNDFYFDKRYHKRYNKRNFRVPLPEAVEYSSSNKLPIDPYILGLLLGDGGFTGKNVITFTNKHLKLVEQVAIYLGRDIKDIKYKQGAYFISLYRRAVSSFKELGLFGKLSVDKFIPTVYKTASIKDRKKLLQGLLDTDGHKMRKHYTEYASSSKELYEDVVNLARSLGCYVKQGKVRTPKYKYKGEVKTGKEAYRCFIDSNKTYKSIEKVEKVGECECQCIMVEDETHTYITDNFTVTHNTYILPAIVKGLGQRTLILVDKKDLVDQMVEEFEKNSVGLDLKVLTAKNKEFGEVTITTFQFLLKNMNLLEEHKNEIGCVIIDEAHLISIGAFTQVVNKLPAKYRIGLSATPTRSDGLTEAMFDVMGNYIVEGTNPDLLKVNIVRMQQLTTVTKGSKDSAITMWSNFYKQPKVIAPTVKATQHMLRLNRAVLVYATQVSVQEELKSSLKELGISSEIINQKTKQSERKELLNKFEAREIDVLIAGTILQKGISVHRLDTIINHSNHTKESLEQLVGRLRRPHKEKKPPIFIDFLYEGRGRWKAGDRFVVYQKLKADYKDKINTWSYIKTEKFLEEGIKK